MDDEELIESFVEEMKDRMKEDLKRSGLQHDLTREEYEKLKNMPENIDWERVVSDLKSESLWDDIKVNIEEVPIPEEE